MGHKKPKLLTTCLCSPLYNHLGRWGTKNPSYLQLAYVHPYITIPVDGAQKKQVTYNLLTTCLCFISKFSGICLLSPAQGTRRVSRLKTSHLLSVDLFTLTSSRNKTSLKAQDVPLVICWFVTVWNHSVSWRMWRWLTIWKMTQLVTGPKSDFLSFLLLKMCWNFIIFVILIFS